MLKLSVVWSMKNNGQWTSCDVDCIRTLFKNEKYSDFGNMYKKVSHC